MMDISILVVLANSNCLTLPLVGAALVQWNSNLTRGHLARREEALKTPCPRGGLVKFDYSDYASDR